MKKFQVLVILAAFCSCQSADSQTPSDIHVLQATYGAGTQQTDVTTKVQSLIQSGQTNVHVRSQLFGKDPSFGKVKTLTVLFTSNGVQYCTDIREGDLLSFSDARPLSGTTTPAGATQRARLGATDGWCVLRDELKIMRRNRGTHYTF
jgi:hypothetical protein